MRMVCGCGVVGAQTVGSRLMVACVAIRDARALVDALADPSTLYVFGVIAARTSTLGMGAAVEGAVDAVCDAVWSDAGNCAVAGCGRGGG